MKLKCLIVDDEPLAHKVIVNYASDLNYLDIVAQAYRPTEALQILRAEVIDLMFLDIQMPKMSGLEMLRISPSHPIVIITSAYEEYALEGYELKVCDYLLKPFRLGRFLQATEKALQEFELQQRATGSESKDLLIKSDKRFIKVAIDDIHYFESYGNYVKVWKRSECIVTPRTLSSFESELDAQPFYKTHKSFIVNKNHIAYVEGNSIMMNNKKLLPLSKNYKPEFMDFFKKG